jgi:hypothetical protein
MKEHQRIEWKESWRDEWLWNPSAARQESDLFRPGGTFENSPAIHRWVARHAGERSPVGTTEPPASRLSRPYGTIRNLWFSRPSTEVLGYYQSSLRDVKCGTHSSLA